MQKTHIRPISNEDLTSVFSLNRHSALALNTFLVPDYLPITVTCRGTQASWRIVRPGALALKLPVATAHGTLRAWLLTIYPLENAVEMKCVIAHTPNYGAVISRYLAIWATTIECTMADAASLVVNPPCPRCHSIPMQKIHLHCVKSLGRRKNLKSCSSQVGHKKTTSSPWIPNSR